MAKEVAVITGASKGIGKAIAFNLADEGKLLALFGRNKEQLNQIKKEINNKVEVLVFAGDVGDQDFVDASIKEVISKFGKIDHLINNAGLGIFKKFTDSNLDEFKDLMNANVYGVYNFTKYVLPGMIERKSGSIITISSLAGKNGFVGGTMYAATKHAVMGFSRSLLMEVRDSNIKVASVCPGSVATDMITNTMIHPGDFETVLGVEDVAAVVSTIIKLPARATVSEVEIRPTNPK